jgi:hypothetical protein
VLVAPILFELYFSPSGGGAASGERGAGGVEVGLFCAQTGASGARYA